MEKKEPELQIFQDIYHILRNVKEKGPFDSKNADEINIKLLAHIEKYNKLRESAIENKMRGKDHGKDSKEHPLAKYDPLYVKYFKV